MARSAFVVERRQAGDLSLWSTLDVTESGQEGK